MFSILGSKRESRGIPDLHAATFSFSGAEGLAAAKGPTDDDPAAFEGLLLVKVHQKLKTPLLPNAQEGDRLAVPPRCLRPL